MCKKAWLRPLYLYYYTIYTITLLKLRLEIIYSVIKEGSVFPSKEFELVDNVAPLAHQLPVKRVHRHRIQRTLAAEPVACSIHDLLEGGATE